MGTNYNYLDKNILKRINLAIETRRRPVTYIVLILLVAFSVILPIILGIIFYEKLSKGFIVSIIIYWVVGFYFLRLLLWNRFGVEEIEVSRSYIRLYHNYRYFRLKHGVITTDSLQISFLPARVQYDNEKKKGKYVTLIFYSNKLDLKSSVPVKFDKAVKLN